MNRNADARALLMRAFAAAIARVEPGSALHRSCRWEPPHLDLGAGETVQLQNGGRIWIIGAGKAAPGMAGAAWSLFSGDIAGASIVTKDGTVGLPEPIPLMRAAHPIPDVRSVQAAEDALRLVSRCDPPDLILCLLSGGASALWAAPVATLPLRSLQRTTTSLLHSGATIEELNTVRKHLSRIAGGRLASASRAGTLLTLAISDVLESPPEVIGSGPTVPDPTTFDDALRILRNYVTDVDPAVLTHLQAGASGRVEETPKPGDPSFAGTHYRIIADLDDAIDAVAVSAAASGAPPVVVERRMEGEAREVGHRIAAEILQASRSGTDGPRLLVWGGESTVTVTGDGRGGRNQEMALAIAIAIADVPGITVACLATDGDDGPTGATGGIVDGWTVHRAADAGRNCAKDLSRNDSNSCLAAAGDLIVTGMTGTNVGDLVLALLTPEPASGPVTTTDGTGPPTV